MVPRIVFIAAGTLALLAAVPSTAADLDLETVIVTATRFSEADPSVAANVSIISRQDIRNTPGQSLPEVLSTRAGIEVRSLGGTLGRDATVDMRGFGATATSNTLILVDGQRLNPVDMGSIIWSAIPLESVERIEIVRGSGSVLYGDGATGGVINIITNKSGKPVASISTTLGSNADKGTDLQLSNGNDRAYYNLFVNYADAGGYRKNSQQDQQTASGRVGLLLERGEAFADFSIYKESAGLPGSIFSTAFQRDPRSTRFPRNTENREGYRIRPGISVQLGERITLEAEAGVEHQNLNSNIVSSSYMSDRDRDTVSLTPRLRWRHGVSDLSSETVMGADFYDSEIRSNNLGGPNQGADQRSSALYLQNTTGITENLSLALGAREQRVKQSARQDAYPAWFSPAMSGNATRSRNAFDLGLNYAREYWRVYGKSGTTFRFANADELFGFDNVLFVPVFAGDIKPQHGRINEIGGGVSLGSVRLRASLYHLDLTDEIGYDSSVGANINLSPTRRKGGELEADWKLSDTLQARVAYAHVDARFRSGVNSGKEIPLVARHQASSQIVWNAGGAGTYSTTVRYTGDRRYGSDFSNAHGMLSDYTTIDLQAVWEIRPWKLTARVLNATDRKYSPVAGYSATYNDTYYYPADGRSISMTARIDL